MLFIYEKYINCPALNGIRNITQIKTPVIKNKNTIFIFSLL
jgi:hypothetical protein